MTTDRYATNTPVRWTAGDEDVTGKISRVFDEGVPRPAGTTNSARLGNDENPAYLVTQDDGREILKLHSELSPIR